MSGDALHLSYTVLRRFLDFHFGLGHSSLPWSVLKSVYYVNLVVVCLSWTMEHALVHFMLRILQWTVSELCLRILQGSSYFFFTKFYHRLSTLRRGSPLAAAVGTKMLRRDLYKIENISCSFAFWDWLWKSISTMGLFFSQFRFVRKFYTKEGTLARLEGRRIKL